ncbi:hypothetical protein E2562_001091 [Oryza meyeriana var. granulata]|uniref:Uncharacterized protein n=1 Tax=Oryza meyeriana var. granulata TaxID=110450 RepID=A0A6G1EE36_9ORYZ|nr:hypothetical protein E2562_001091 [Oryza meyeriana var. granulata]
MTQMETDSPRRTGWGSGRRRGLVEGEAGMRRRETWRSRRPSVECLLERFLESESSLPATAMQQGKARVKGMVGELNRQYGELRAVVDTHKALRERVEEIMEKERAARSRSVAWMEAEAQVANLQNAPTYLQA